MFQCIKLIELWNEARMIFDNADFDIMKSSRGNISAGFRSRKALRMLRNIIIDMLVESRAYDKALRQDRIDNRPQLTPEQKIRRYSALKRKRDAELRRVQEKREQKISKRTTKVLLP